MGLDRRRDGIPAGDRAESELSHYTPLYGDYLANMGRSEEGLRETKRAQELDPLSLIINTTLGWQLYLARRSDQAIEQLRKVLDIDARFTPARRGLGEGYSQTGRQKEAVEERGKAGSLSGSPEMSAP